MSSSLIESLERRRLFAAAAFSLHVNFQSSGSPVPSGYLADTGAVFADRGNGFSYGWNLGASSAARDRNSSKSPDQRYDTLIHTQMFGVRTWEAAVPNGEYNVHVVAGDPSFFGSVIKFDAEGFLVASGNQTSATPFIDGTTKASVSDGRLTITNAAGASNNKICFVEIDAVDDANPPPAFAAKINFQPTGAALPTGYLADTGNAFATRGNGLSYGWSASNTANTRDRNSSTSPDQRYDTLDHFKSLFWELAVPSGDYKVRVVVGDPIYTDSVYGLDAEGLKIVGGTPTANQHWFDGMATVHVADGRLTLTNSAGSSNNRICFIEVTSIGDIEPPPSGDTITWNAGKSSPIARSEAMTATIDGKMYVLGGYTDSTFTPTKRVDVYDPAADSWTRLTNSDMPVALSHSGCTVLGSSIVIAGGYPAKATGGQTFSTTGVWSLNIDTGIWSTLPSLPAARGGGALVNLDGTLHFFGGADSSRKDANTHWQLPPTLNPGGPTWTALAPLPTNRNHMGAVVLNGKIYAVGGQQNQDAAEIPQAAVEVWDPSSGQWSSAKSLPFGRSHIAGATTIVNGRIVVLGGETTFNSTVNDVSAYDPAKDEWVAMSDLPVNINSGVAGFVDGLLIYSTGRFATKTYRGTIS
jgi:N-acetylneuraminic acid mutarotase